MKYDDWESASEGKHLQTITITLTKEYLNPEDGKVYCHNVLYTMPTYGHSCLGEVEFSTLKHNIEDNVKKLQYKFDARHRRTKQHLQNIYKHA